MVAPVSAQYHMKITVHWKHLEHRFAHIILHIDWQHYSWGQKSVSKHMHLCTLPYKLASPAAITSWLSMPHDSVCLWSGDYIMNFESALESSCQRGIACSQQVTEVKDSQRFAVSAIVQICRNGHTGARIQWYTKHCKPHRRPSCCVVAVCGVFCWASTGFGYRILSPTVQCP